MNQQNNRPPSSPRAKVHWLDRAKTLPVVREWNRLHPIGTRCDLAGQVVETESPAARDVYWRPCVFVSGIDEPVLLASLRPL